MSSFAPGGGITQTSGNVTLTSDKVSPVILNSILTTAGTEYTITLRNCVSFLLKSRLLGTLQLSYISGNSGSIYLTIPRGTIYTESDMAPATRILYVQSSIAMDTLEIVYWTP